MGYFAVGITAIEQAMRVTAAQVYPTIAPSPAPTPTNVLLAPAVSQAVVAPTAVAPAAAPAPVFTQANVLLAPAVSQAVVAPIAAAPTAAPTPVFTKANVLLSPAVSRAAAVARAAAPSAAPRSGSIPKLSQEFAEMTVKTTGTPEKKFPTLLVVGGVAALAAVWYVFVRKP